MLTRHQWLTPVILAEIRKIKVQGQPVKIVHEILLQKYSIQKQGWQSGLMTEHLPSKCEALSSHSSTTKIYIYIYVYIYI
jgi:hypothetical protein